MEKIVILQGRTGALIERRGTTITEYVSAWGYDPETGTWAQGHYFTPYPQTEENKAEALQKALEHFNKNYR